jgi:CRP-like cAMP-binding protein
VQDIVTMFGRLREHVAGRIPLSEDEFLLCSSQLVPKRLRKDNFLFQEGERVRYLAFVTKGCLRSYTVDKKGEEHIVQFAPEGWWITDMYSFLTGKESTMFADALEESDVLLLDATAYENLCTTIPKFERYFRILLQNHYVATQRRVLASISLSAEEQYLQLSADYPTIAQRVALRHIASYLGITPEALSRIRHRIANHSKT